MLDKFVNRKTELGILEDRFRSTKAELLIIYGRRRVGKTELLKRFAKGKPHIYFLADRRIIKDQVLELSRRVGEYFQDETLVTRGLETTEDVLVYLAKRSASRLVLIFDEFPYLVESDKAVTSILQKFWDEGLKDSLAMVILCGSSISMMEHEVLAQRSPLYGRRTGQWLVEPLLPNAAREFFPSYDLRRAFEAYAVLGGIPLYLNQFDDRKPVFENIKQTVLRKDALLYAEPEFLLREELREPKTYFSLLKYLSFGKVRINELADVMGMGRNEVSRYVATLEQLRIVERVVPVTEKHPHKSRKGIYTIADPFLNFWFRFVYPNRTDLEAGEAESVIERAIKPNFDSYVGSIFEQACVRNARTLMAKTSVRFHPARIGRTWKGDIEVDLLAMDEHGKFAAYEIKWSTVSQRDVDNLVQSLRAKLTALDLDTEAHLGVIARDTKGPIRANGVVLTLRDLLES